ncbi:MAG: adenine deaminase [Firmicutes bacterium HGW-Firmicutes-16]|nr:MAG: adenine deaminase [Firmicutes bacterium HGW-Firmicutes-16]
MRTFNEIKNTIETGLGRYSCDLKLANVRLVNVFSSEIYDTNISIKNGRIVSIDPSVELEALETIDCHGHYAVPGLIDSHMHFETTMLSPEALASVVVPQGTTTLCADLMEIANVAGTDGLKAMLESISRLPYRMLIEVSSRVPTAPGLETNGAYMGAEAVREIMDWQEAVSLGELDPSKILFVGDDYIEKIADTLARRKIVNGHAIGRMGQELNVYASAGISDDHECVTPEELLARLRVGMSVLIREGSTERNVDELISGVVREGLPLDNLMFCTDDKHPGEIKHEGHINYNVSRSIELGMKPMDAIKLATINAAKHFRLEDEIGVIAPGRLADVLIIPDLKTMRPEKVFFEGKLVAENGSLTQECPVSVYPEWIKNTVHLMKPMTADAFIKPAITKEGSAEVLVIDLIDRQIINRKLVTALPCSNGQILPDIERDIAKLAVVERYGKTGGVGIGFVRGFGLRSGALAFSTSHDHHNIVTVGANDADMALAVNTVASMQGGLCVADGGSVLAKMCLPIGGLMSEKTADEVMAELDVLNREAKNLGCTGSAPFMTLSFISLPTVPELGLTDMGLVDVLEHKLIQVEQ